MSFILLQVRMQVKVRRMCDVKGSTLKSISTSCLNCILGIHIMSISSKIKLARQRELSVVYLRLADIYHIVTLSFLNKDITLVHSLLCYTNFPLLHSAMQCRYFVTYK